MLAMEPTDSAVSASTSHKTEDRNHSTSCTRTPFMISDILDSSRRSPRQRSTEDCSSDPEDDSRSVDEERDRASASDTESAADGEGDREPSKDDSPTDELCCGGSPKSPTAGSPGENFCT